MFNNQFARFARAASTSGGLTIGLYKKGLTATGKFGLQIAAQGINRH